MDALSECSLTYTNHEPYTGNLDNSSFIKIVYYEGNATGNTDFLTECSQTASGKKHHSNISKESAIEINYFRETVPTDFASRNTEVNISGNQYFSECYEKPLTETDSLKEHMIIYSNFLGVSETHPNENGHSYKLGNVPLNELSNSKEPILFCAVLGSTELSNSNQHFTCGYCEKSFAEVCHLDEHMASHANLSESSIIESDKKQYACGLCEKSFSKVDDLKRHIRVHVKSYVEKVDGYPCGLCNMSFTTVDDLKEHITFHTGKSSFSCGLCKKHFNKIDDLRKHVNGHVLPGNSNIYTERKLYSCGLCDGSFYEIAELLTHRRVHFRLATRKITRQEIHFNMDNKLYYCCRLCNVSFITAIALEQHVKAHAVCKDLEVYAGRNLYCCGLCDYSFSNVSECGTHIAIHLNFINQNVVNLKTRNSRKRYFCHLCYNSFTNVYYLKGHIRDHKYLNSKTQSAEKMGYTCVLCEKTYTTVKSYRAHIRNHAKYFILKDLTDDEKCSFSFSKEFTKSYLKTEIKICACLSYDSENYMAEKQYCCGICDKTFAEMDSLKEHLELHGIYANIGNARLYSCGLCWLFFSTLGDLKEHLTLRSDVLRYGLLMKDDKDKNITKNVSNLNMHNEVVRYFCDLCNNSFTNIFVLKSHIKGHNKCFNTETKAARERRYSCVLCDKAYTTIPSYKKHIHKHAKYFLLKDYTVDEKCPLMFHQLFTKSPLKEEVKICSCLSYDSENYMAEKQYGCAICEKSFAEMNSLKEHSELHGISANAANAKLYSCGLCWALFVNIDDLEQHVILRSDVLRYGLLTKDEKGQDFIINAGKSQYSCGLCNESYSNVSELKTHIRVHSSYFKSKTSTKLKQYSCGLCEKSFEEVDGLRAHIQMHTKSISNAQANQEVYTCTLNEESLVQVNESKQHSPIHGQITGGCSDYKKDFSGRNNLEKRQLLNHKRLAKSNFTCNYFDVLQSINISNEEIELKRHVSCDTSVDKDKEFHTNSSSKRMKRPPFTSGYCKKSFQSLKLLKYHLRVHTGEKPYSCDYCEKAFTYRKQFLMHLETHTKPSNN